LNAAVNLSLTAPPDFDVILLGGNSKDEEGEVIDSVCETFGIHNQLKKMSGTLPCQTIELTKGGERTFAEYDVGLLDSLQVDPDVAHSIKTSDAIVTLAFDQFHKHLDPIIACKGQTDLIVDFMDMKDFKGDIRLVERYSKELAIGFFGLEAKPDRELIAGLESLSTRCGSLFVVTLGKFGAVAIKDGKVLRVNTEEVDEVKDSTGAGDAFIGAFLGQYISGKSLKKALTYANRYAAESLGHIGSFAWPPK
jgi:sugar/nucleoside kinase (ribokinase family)